MNQQIRVRTANKLFECQNKSKHSFSFHLEHQQREYVVLPMVFSPAIFSGTQWLTYTLLAYLNTHPFTEFLEIGVGCGVTSIQVVIKFQGCKVSASDINPKAIQNTKLNAQKFKADLQIVESDRLSSFPNREFDVIYWNYPFHPSEKKQEQLSMLERAIMDPGYTILAQYLSIARKYLKQNGYLLFGFSHLMGDLQLLQQISYEYKWKYKQLARMPVEQGSICLIRLD